MPYTNWAIRLPVIHALCTKVWGGGKSQPLTIALAIFYNPGYSVACAVVRVLLFGVTYLAFISPGFLS